MRVIDLHCDTVGEMYDRSLRFDCGALDINSNIIDRFDEYIPVTAIWSRKDLSGEECYSRFLSASENAEEKLAEYPHVPAVEGAKLLCGDISRLDVLSEKGVKILTLTWAGVNELGGSHDTHAGLTDFGKRVVKRCFELGIIPDVSHASDETFAGVRELARKAGKAFIASHSNSRVIWKHARNLTDDMYLDVADSGGVVGVSLEPTHLGEIGNMQDAVSHIAHYYTLDPQTVCLGCDFDGRTSRPSDMTGADCLFRIWDELLKIGFSQNDADAVFYGNAKRFFDKNNITYFRK